LDRARSPLLADTVEKLDFLSQFLKQQASFKKKALRGSAERLTFLCAATAANWWWQSVALSALRDQTLVFWRRSFSEFFNSIGPKRTIWRADLWLCRRCSAVSK
jgi:hypothetical protein